MRLSKEQANLLAERFDGLAPAIAQALTLDQAGARTTCDKLEQVYERLRELSAQGNEEAYLFQQLVAALQAAVEARFRSD
jgi:hypothetical protein